MKKLLLTFLIILFTLTSNVVWSADYNKGWDAYDSGDYATALREFKPLAEQGDDDAQFYMGLMYEKGNGVPQDYKTAVKWYTLAAEQGDSSSQYNLGLMYYYGDGVIQDNVSAHMWVNISASNGKENRVKARDTIAKEMTSADISQAQNLARECVAKNYKGC